MFLLDDTGFREMEEQDIELFRKMRNNQSTWINLTDVDFISKEKQEEWFKNLKESNTAKSYTAIHMNNNYDELVLGRIRADCIDQTNRSIRIGLDILQEIRGQGWGKRVYKALLYYYFMHNNFHRIWLLVMNSNEIGVNLYKKVGFSEEGRMRDAIWRNGKWNDYIMMSILDSEYIPKRKEATS